MVSPAPRPGFTLIEMMMVVLIGGVLVAGGLAAYRGLGEKETVKQAGLTLQSNLRLFQQKALSGEKPEGCLGLLTGFRVNSQDLYSYQARADCDSGNSTWVSYSLPEGVQWQNLWATDLVFAVLRNGVSGAQTITLTSTSGSFSYQVTVEGSGVISGAQI